MLTAISLFTGAGGLDLGFEAAGFRIAASVELDPDARQTIRENRPQWGLLDEGDIHLLNPDEMLSSHRLGKRQVDIIIAGPPCQAFSKSALWSKGTTGRLEDPRAKVFDPLLSLVEAASPSAVVVENVRGIVTEDDVISKFQERLAKINMYNGTEYLLNTVCLNAHDYGVPQKRERAFLIAFRDGRKFSPPTKTHTADQKGEAYRTAWDAIGDLDGYEKDDELTLRGKWADLVSSIPEGRNYLYHTSKGGGLPLFGWRTRYWTFLLKLSKNQPSWTLQAQPGPATGPFHWKNRQLSIREMCRLQTFPDQYKIWGSYRSARRQIGNAVPAALAEALARQVRNYLDGTMFTGAASLATPKRPGCPTPEPPQAPPPEFLRLVGAHSDHPGAGRGPRAVLR
ncbi:MAG: DNA cytosine methyltransferase [Stellaceae bacterium]